MKFWLDGFYDDNVHTFIPKGAKAITEELYDYLLNNQGTGGRSIATGTDGLPYLAEPLPPTGEELKRMRIAEIETRLTSIDLATLRPLRAKETGTASAFDLGKLVRLEVEAGELRAEMARLALAGQEAAEDGGQEEQEAAQ